ncbi:MAG TPA: hypothetical protein VNC15_07535, partial [Solirubrobacterales bacterium]|nr:hypothetical protein [Solirubrobacterales bacterium]
MRRAASAPARRPAEPAGGGGDGGDRVDPEPIVTGLVILLILTVTAVLAAVAVAFEAWHAGPFDWKPLVRDYAVSLAAVATAVLAAFVFARFHPDGIRQSRERAQIRSVIERTLAEYSSGVRVVDQWDKEDGPVRLLREGGQVVICTRFCDTWVEQNEDEIVDFFRSGGVLEVLLPDPDCESAHAITAHQRAWQKDPALYAKKARDTAESLQSLMAKSGRTADALTIKYVEEALNYSCWFHRDRGELFVVWYEQRMHEA